MPKTPKTPHKRPEPRGCPAPASGIVRKEQLSLENCALLVAVVFNNRAAQVNVLKIAYNVLSCHIRWVRGQTVVGLIRTQFLFAYFSTPCY
jgi:hypothetical protein